MFSKTLNFLKSKFFKKEYIHIQDKIIVFGDSHCRAFSNNPNFMPIFVGEGRKYCFIEDATSKNIENSILSILKNFKNVQNIILCFGEPDTRYYLGKGWNPWEIKKVSNIKKDNYQDIDEKLKQSVNRYISVINKVKNKFNGRLMILNVTHSLRVEQNNLVDKFNIELKKSLPKNFIDINNLIFSKKKNVINKEYMGDVVHLNNKLQIPVENWLLKNDVITKKRYKVNPEWDNKEIQRKFSYDAKFGCYRIKE